MSVLPPRNVMKILPLYNMYYETRGGCCNVKDTKVSCINLGGITQQLLTQRDRNVHLNLE
jgi:hypothetical protein